MITIKTTNYTDEEMSILYDALEEGSNLVMASVECDGCCKGCAIRTLCNSFTLATSYIGAKLIERAKE